MKYLVLLHVLSAIIGVGPTFFGHVLYRKKQTANELRVSVKLMAMLEFFPKIGGSIAVLSGLLLFFLNDYYGPFTQVWLLGSLILYILIQIVVIGLATPPARKLAAWLSDPANKNVQDSLPEEPKLLLHRVNGLFYLASGMGTLLFIFMILKP
ncbi:DUF2269 family protein [Paenibacillus koleovorans]|uniref:DUF2269 family protein n=1 Tax=Paenibacillus koleovorans TaxID=121608 RepID=UPI000FD828E3|nr:DUF2269 family protein [Paenibacillus koleovorans]